jgi:hypothetical protein
MKRSLPILCFATLAAISAPAQSSDSIKKEEMPAAAQQALLNQYCIGCHNQKTKSGGLALDRLDPGHAGNDAETWEKVVRKLRAGMMPPASVKRPDPATYQTLRISLENELDRAATEKSRAAPPGLHRVNRVEYANAVRDLTGLDIDPAALLPVDDSSYGFDNIASSLSISPAQVEGYVSAAAKISRLALGHETEIAQQRFLSRSDRSEETHVEGLPLGTRGGLSIRNYFPADGEYVISWFPVRDYNANLFARNRKGEQLEVLVDGTRAKLFDFDKLLATTTEDKNEVRLFVKAGLRTVGVTFLATTQVPVDDLNQHSLRSVISSGPMAGYLYSPQIGQVIITGPYNGTRPRDLPSRRKILLCEPSSAADEISCAKKILTALAREAYRRPANPADLEELLSDYQEGRNKGDFENGIERALQALLADPEFIYRAEAAPPSIEPGELYRISDLELASRLAFFLWSAPPDERLIRLAGDGKLRNAEVLEQETRRMLADPRSHALTTNFAGQWLQLRNLAAAAPITLIFPDFDDNLREAFKTETEMLFDSIVREDHSVTDLLNNDYTFVNERLARHYGIPNIYGSRFRRVKLDGPLEVRRGLLGQGSIELVTALADRTSPVQRGKWVLMNILGIIPPDPPPNVPTLKESDNSGNGLAAEPSMRERMEAHRANPTCASCHRMFDPIGFSLESFDAVGKYRTTDSGRTLDLSGQFVDGAKFNGPSGLRQALLGYSPQFVQVLTEKLLTYALGRGVEYYDMPTVRAVDREANRNGDRFSSLVLGIVRSEPFQMSVKPADTVSP